jgi:hypothetical protein
MKICPKCKNPSDDFYSDSTKKGGFSTYCKSCTSARAGEYYRGRGRKIHLLCAARRRAKIKGIPFTLTADDFEIPEFCPVLGIKLIVSTGRGASPESASLDRIDLTLGYVKGNVQVISLRANSMKNDASPDELRRFAAWINKEYPEGGDAK